jgi:hypothetical protein
MTPEQHKRVQFETLQRAIDIIQAYQNRHWRRLRVAQVCFELKSLLQEAADRVRPASEPANAPKAEDGQGATPRRRASDIVETGPAWK